MKKKSLVWHVYPSYLLLSLVAMLAVAVSAVRIIKTFHYEQTERELTSAASLVRRQIEAVSGPVADADIDGLCKTLGRASGYRITVVLPSGEVIGDSDEDPAAMDNHGRREEIVAAVKFGRGTSQRYSDTIREKMLYVALPIAVEDKTGVVRTSLSLASIDQAVVQVWGQIALAAAFIALIAVVATAILSHRIGRPLRRIQSAVMAFGWGKDYERLPASHIIEVDILANTLNIMADQLNERIAVIQEKSDEQSALLSCMIESVIAVDTDRNVIRINRAAEKMFNVKSEDCTGRSLMEVVRNADLLDLAGDALADSEPAEKDLFLQSTNTYLQGHGSVLRNADGEKIGAVIVLHDITRIRNMERMRRDFVANVSHELKTPITSVLGYAETLREGGVESEEDRDRFLAVIERQARRLQSIVEDLLALSEIEDGVQKGEVNLEERAVAPVVRGAVSNCRAVAEKKNIRVEIDCDENLTGRLNDALMEQAVINLVGNAVRYSEPETRVAVSVKAEGGEIVLRVRDEGSGIDRKHLARLFERFYRVDKGRSRKLGGTGLGLAIVKHVALAHHGRVDVQSELGRGSTFSIFIPGS